MYKDKWIEKESGSVLIMFAFLFTFLMIFLALSTDIVMAFNHRDYLNEIGHMMREARFDLNEEIWNSEDPRGTLLEVSREIGRANGLRDDQIHVLWEETTNNPMQRNANVSVIIEDTYETSTLSMFGIKKLPIRVVIKGYQFKSLPPESWRPRRHGW